MLSHVLLHVHKLSDHNNNPRKMKSAVATGFASNMSQPTVLSSIRRK